MAGVGRKAGERNQGEQGGGTSEWKEIAERGNNACEPGKDRVGKVYF